MIFEKQVLAMYRGMMYTRCDDNGTAYYFSADDFPAGQEQFHPADKVFPDHGVGGSADADHGAAAVLMDHRDVFFLRRIFRIRLLQLHGFAAADQFAAARLHDFNDLPAKSTLVDLIFLRHDPPPLFVDFDGIPDRVRPIQ